MSVFLDLEKLKRIIARHGDIIVHALMFDNKHGYFARCSGVYFADHYISGSNNHDYMTFETPRINKFITDIFPFGMLLTKDKLSDVTHPDNEIMVLRDFLKKYDKYTANILKCALGSPFKIDGRGYDIYELDQRLMINKITDYGNRVYHEDKHVSFRAFLLYLTYQDDISKNRARDYWSREHAEDHLCDISFIVITVDTDL